jgi:hypothetical protein
MRKWLVLGLVLLFLAACEGNEWFYRLPYAGPVEKEIAKGEALPGAPIRYLGKTDDGARVSIDDKQATKKIGDSLDWRQDVLPGVDVDQTYRVALITEDTLHVAGTARIIVRDPRPQAEPANTEAPMHFKLPVGYHVDVGTIIPGTVITYVGKTDQGAELGNIEGYEFRKVGDSIVWEGKLREGFWVGLDLRTVLITDSTLDVVGTADLWIVPAQP